MKKLIQLLLLSAFLVGGCEYVESDNPMKISELQINFNNLPAVSDTTHYVYWFTYGADEKKPLYIKDSITVAQDGSYSTVIYPAQQNIYYARTFTLSVEKKGKAASAPGLDKVFEQAFESNVATLKSVSPDTLKYGKATGSAIIKIQL